MTPARSARLEFRVTPAQKDLLAQGAAARGMTVTEYAVAVLVGAALRDTSSEGSVPSGLGWMRGTASVLGDLVGPTDPDARGGAPGCNHLGRSATGGEGNSSATDQDSSVSGTSIQSSGPR